MTKDSGHPASFTSDNIHLSELIPDCLQSANGGNCNPLSIRDHTDRKVLELVAAATAANTRRAYESDVRHFQRWGGVIPATDELVARYLADLAGVLAIATLGRRLVAIRSAHVVTGLADPTKSELVRLTLQGIRRRFGRPQRRAAALRPGDILAIIGTLGHSAKDTRDAAILLVGFFGAFRRTELVTLDRDSIDIRETGILIRIRRSKTDQIGHGRLVSIPRIQGTLCPVSRLERWLHLSRIDKGPIFRPVTKSGEVRQTRISAEAVSCIVKRCVSKIGRGSDGFSGHSLRAGFVTSAAMMGVPLWTIRAQTGHTSNSVLQKYIRESEFDSGDIVRIVAGSMTA